ncbi:phosphohydrolase, partial [Salmonella enterica]|nr:phosphohydrolase [Salmonella enterica]ELC7447354.1 phosphohydrolase [Enterobacter hormaechei]HCJ7377303.1 phosphohydrolase [Enterobacter hormaechei subsp. xiangfangensis]HDW3740761.1 phosphohydrolase [Escherichia coli]ELD4708584.1 phosphohydrolase [Salmonella enterica]
DFLLGQGFAREHADTVAHAIAVHLNYHVPAEEHGAEAFLVTRGAICDVFGTGVSRMSQQSVKDVLAKYSRDELYSVFSATAFEHLVGTRFEVSFKAVTSGLVETIPHALDLPPFV